MVKKYELQFLYEDNKEKKLKTWKSTFRTSDDLNTLKIFVPNENYRIVDSITKNVIWEYHDSNT